MCKTDEKTRQYYFFTATKFPTEAEKIGFAKTHHELIIDFGGQKRNQIQPHSPLQKRESTGASFLYRFD